MVFNLDDSTCTNLTKVGTRQVIFNKRKYCTSYFSNISDCRVYCLNASTSCLKPVLLLVGINKSLKDPFILALVPVVLNRYFLYSAALLVYGLIFFFFSGLIIYFLWSLCLQKLIKNIQK